MTVKKQDKSISTTQNFLFTEILYNAIRIQSYAVHALDAPCEVNAIQDVLNDVDLFNEYYWLTKRMREIDPRLTEVIWKKVELGE